MGQCLGCKKDKQDNVLKQDKNIDDKRMFKLGVDVLNRDFCIQIGYNRKAVKTYGKGERVANLEEGDVCQPPPDRVEDPTAFGVVS